MCLKSVHYKKCRKTTFWHLLQQLEHSTLPNERLWFKKVESRREECGRHLLLFQQMEASVQPLLGSREHQQSSGLSGRLLAHQQVPASRVGHPVDLPHKPQKGDVRDQNQAEWDHHVLVSRREGAGFPLEHVNPQEQEMFSSGRKDISEMWRLKVVQLFCFFAL